MSRVVRWAAAVLAVAGVVAAVLVSRHTTARSVNAAVSARQTTLVNEADLAVLASGPPPSIEEAAGWLNSAGVTDASLRGKVVLYDFWTFACINCQHTLSHVKAWQEGALDVGDQFAGSLDLPHLRPLTYHVLGQRDAENVGNPHRAVGVFLSCRHRNHIPFGW